VVGFLTVSLLQVYCSVKEFWKSMFMGSPLFLESPWNFWKNFPFFKALESPWERIWCLDWNLISQVVESAWIPKWSVITITCNMVQSSVNCEQYSKRQHYLLTCRKSCVTCWKLWWNRFGKGHEGAWKSLKSSWFCFPPKQCPPCV